MACTPQTWTNGDVNTPLSAARLNYIEAGVDNALEKTGDVATGPLTLQSTSDGGLDKMKYGIMSYGIHT